MDVEDIKNFELKVTDNQRLVEWIGKTKSVIPAVRVVIDPVRKQVIVNYHKLTPNQQLIMDLMLIEIT